MSAGATGRLSGRHLAIPGPGYAAQELARQAMAEGACVSGATRDAAKAERLRTTGITVLATGAGELCPNALAEVTDLLISVSPTPKGCPALAMAGPALARAPRQRWIGYFSSTAVHGDCGGAWIDEDRLPAPDSRDALARFFAENRRLRNDRMLALPGFRLRFPDWHAGYRSIIAGGAA